jgi:hypothetical protein
MTIEEAIELVVGVFPALQPETDDNTSDEEAEDE